MSQEPAKGACGTLMTTPHLSQSHTHLLSHLSLPWHLHHHQVFHTQTLPWTVHSPNQLSCGSFNQWIKTVCVGVGEWVGGWVEQGRERRTEKVSDCCMHSWMDERYPVRKKRERITGCSWVGEHWQFLQVSFFLFTFIYLDCVGGNVCECVHVCVLCVYESVHVLCVWECS